MTVYLVGAGPGDPGLLTLRGAELLSRADVVVYDRLAPAALLALASPSAELVSAAKAPGAVDLTQDEINALLVDRGTRRGTVVRLKGGDPYVFGRGGEEAEALAAAGVGFEVVPGITSAIGAPAYAGIPVTHRGASSHFTVVTGHEDPAKVLSGTDWHALARAGGTLVVLMGAGRIGEIARALIDGGLDGSTPVTAVRNGTRPDQETIRATLATIGEAGVRAPSVIVVGEVAALALTWFTDRPLSGRRVLVTRAREQASELRRKLVDLGADVVELPAIRIEPVDVDLRDVDRYAWIVFTSANGVDAFFDRGLTPRGLDSRALAHSRVAVIGPATRKALAARGIAADLVPDTAVGESLLDAFPEPDGDARVLIARAEGARDVVPDGLSARGYQVDILPVYRTVPVATADRELMPLRNGEIDAVTFTSSSTVANLCDALAELPDPFPIVASIGPVTSGAARARGITVDVEATEHTIDGLVDALVGVLRNDTPR